MILRPLATLLRQTYWFLNQKPTVLFQFYSLNWLGLALTLLLNAGCSQLHFPGQQAEAKLEMRVQPSESPGIYRIIGNANLPEETQITIAAVRYLHPAELTSAQFHSGTTYSILDYRSIALTGKTWEASLNLWETDPKGRFQETWQLDQKRLGLTLDPDEDVIFIATLAPVEELSKIEQTLAEEGLKLGKSLVRSTSEGQRYVQVSQTLAIALPGGQTTPPTSRPEDLNGGWGNRYIIPPEPQNPTQIKPENLRKTDAPLNPDEFLQ